MTPTQIIEQAAEKYAAKHRTKGYGYSDNEQDLDNGFCAGAEFALSEPGLLGALPAFNEALDFIKDLCDVLEKNPNDVQTVGNAIMNAMSFYEQHRPPVADPGMEPF